jgi:hypothetical protein
LKVRAEYWVPEYEVPGTAMGGVTDPGPMLALVEAVDCLPSAFVTVSVTAKGPGEK